MFQQQGKHVGYVPIYLQSVFPDSFLLYDIYIYTKDMSAPILYRRRDIKISGQDLEKLEAQGATLYVDRKDLARYQDSLEANLPSIISRTDLSPKQKSAILYDCSTTLMSKIFRDPRAKSVLEQSRVLANTTVQLMKQETTALFHLQQVASRDYYTYTHCVNVMVFSIALAVQLGYAQVEFLKSFGQGALLHDLGKSLIDPQVLNHPGNLSEHNWQVICEHPVLGCRILESIGRTENIVNEIVRHHHEKLNGTGYPDKLSGKRVSRYARIVAIADVFDALTTRRSYKEALGAGDAIALMQNEMHEELDHRYLETFASMVAERKSAHVGEFIDSVETKS